MLAQILLGRKRQVADRFDLRQVVSRNSLLPVSFLIKRSLHRLVNRSF